MQDGWQLWKGNNDERESRQTELLAFGCLSLSLLWLVTAFLFPLSYLVILGISCWVLREGYSLAPSEGL